jgi:hypothetical protein
MVENAEMAATEVWRYSAVLPMESLVPTSVMEETVVLLWDKVLWLTVRMDMKVG